MKRKLVLLNLLLIALTASAIWRLNRERTATKMREQAVLGRPITPAPPPLLNSQPPVQPVTPSNYIDIAQKMLFSRDRNPTVVVEPPPPPATKPMPKLPSVYGVMNFADGPTVIASEKPGRDHRGIHPGERIGEFRLLAVNTEDIVFEWDGKEVRKKLDDVIEREPASAPASAEPPAQPPSNPSPTPPPSPKAQAAPGVDIGKGIRACQPGDTSPAGTVTDGMRKVVTPTPFGPSCRWEPVN